MSGHSKWHNIQKTKGAADAKRSQIFTKIAREMIVAVKTGGSGDPANNSRLATVIAKAKAANMPNDNIKRTIDKALGAGNTDSFESVVYEGYGPNGVAIIAIRISITTATAPRRRFATCWTSTARAWAPPAACPGPLTRRASLSWTLRTWTRTP